jgi:hypothetical protein
MIGIYFKSTKITLKIFTDINNAYFLNRLKKDMVVKVSRVAAEFRRVSNKQMADTTKRTIKENVSINSQLQKMSDKVTELINENDNAKIKVCLFILFFWD